MSIIDTTERVWRDAPARARAAVAPDRRRPARQRPVVVDVLAAAAGIGLGVTIGLAVTGESSGSLSAPGGIAIALGRLTGLLAAYAMVVVVLLVARIPPVERAIGQDRLVAWHRKLGPWPLYLLLAHAVLITIGYARQASDGVLHQFAQLLLTYSGVLAATVGSLFLFAAGITSYRLARRRMLTRHGGRCTSTPISRCSCRSRTRSTRAPRSSAIPSRASGGRHCGSGRWAWSLPPGSAFRCGARCVTGSESSTRGPRARAWSRSSCEAAGSTACPSREASSSSGASCAAACGGRPIRTRSRRRRPATCCASRSRTSAITAPPSRGSRPGRQSPSRAPTAPSRRTPPRAT